MSEPTLYREATEADEGGDFRDVVPVEPAHIRWCLNHRRETWSGRTTCVGMGGSDMCDVVDALLVVGAGIGGHDAMPVVINPEAIGDPDQTPIVDLKGWAGIGGGHE